MNAEEIKIEIKINDEIITNFDLKKEKNYLIALNNNLANLNDSDIKDLIENSLITEKIKFNELKKYFVLRARKYFRSSFARFYSKIKSKR